jgi:hypothetical protein
MRLNCAMTKAGRVSLIILVSALALAFTSCGTLGSPRPSQLLTDSQLRRAFTLPHIATLADVGNRKQGDVIQDYGFSSSVNPRIDAQVIVYRTVAQGLRASRSQRTGPPIGNSLCIGCHTLRVRNVVLLFDGQHITNAQKLALVRALCSLGEPVSP